MIIEHKSDHVVVTLDRPAKRNSMDLDAWTGLREAIEAAPDDAANRAVVIRGDARSFCAGNDIDSMRDLAGPDAAIEYFVDGMLPTFAAMAASPLPMITVVEGAALGGGLEIVVVSDVVIAGPGATFGLPETRIGAWPTVFLAAVPSSSTRRLAARLALVGDTIGPAEALQHDLVSYAVDDVDATLERVLAGIGAAAPDATARSKRWLNRELLASGMPDAAAALTELSRATLQGTEFGERMAAFLEARAARRAALRATRPTATSTPTV
ncbi:enoyl-CoA hydratase/isomerase family protein [Occultella gossypii]|uniref:Enoyl-CoA hydratase/isomerase family protein n=1 Tax=Occultella gossypii TaxID=2800820 RepID=A0ABS7S5A0_9MICO|nr:enoyl-CoA hydratase/isomerase family protein [Occultella gossypii]MBZ2195513.1 enoyl-CoA hydratase/isomerase family protein [Occultella gossypii]